MSHYDMPSGTERRAFQAVVAVLALIPILSGAAGVVLGPDFLGLDPLWPVDLDSHFRFLSGVFLGIGIGFYSCIPGVESKTARFRLLAAFIVAGGLARLWSLLLVGAPSAGHVLGLIMELGIVPLLVVWQARIAAAHAAPAERSAGPD